MFQQNRTLAPRLNELISGAVKIRGCRVIQEAPRVQYKVFPLDLTQTDEHSLRLDANHIPIPRVQPNYAQVFSLTLNQKLRFAVSLSDGLSNTHRNKQAHPKDWKQPIPRCGGLRRPLLLLHRGSREPRYGDRL